MKSLLCALMFNVVACMPPLVPSSNHRHFNFFIKPGLDEKQMQSVINAFAEWEINTNQRVSFVQSSFEDRSSMLIVVYPSKRKDIGTRHHNPTLIGWFDVCGPDNDRCIEIAFDQNARDFHASMLHEIGHSLGLDHLDNKKYQSKTVMTSDTNYASDYLTCTDMQQFCSLWHCRAYELPLCQTNLLGNKK